MCVHKDYKDVLFIQQVESTLFDILLCSLVDCCTTHCIVRLVELHKILFNLNHLALYTQVESESCQTKRILHIDL